MHLGFLTLSFANVKLQNVLTLMCIHPIAILDIPTETNILLAY